jgi:hypothetical protein
VEAEWAINQTAVSRTWASENNSTQIAIEIKAFTGGGGGGGASACPSRYMQITIIPVCEPLSPGFYVATTGSGSNAGTLASPFLTLGKCKTAMLYPRW